MGCDQNLCESSVNVISGFTICMNRELSEKQFSLEIAKITGIGCEWDFTM